MEKHDLLYEGKAKKIYRTDEEGLLWVEYKNSATAFNGEKKASIEGKARLNNEISSLIFSYLKEQGVDSHFVKRLSETEQLIHQVTIIPLEVVVRNVIAGSLAKRIGIEEGTPLEKPLVEFYYKDDDLGDPLVTEDHIAILQAATKEQVDILKVKAIEVNDALTTFFAGIGVKLVDFKLEFGVTADGAILLADEISPDTCRLWDAKTGERFDKDLFRRNLGNLQDGYEQILTRIEQKA
ncbi:phosphoribosylaminoimidazolesuccinocarboxamide synthase [Halalkalibacterium halodurans]|jgi:phosphoribosylaminoimidazole-succinocarboxamide synthase|uniref:Phosphoribosylaminoimidazole-succinocarboxamide synthase n=2 Tax=Halalkalibacterium halodurans TaxID=86665 RepID=PUR7_HALH5|nr:phosphoribosylaminoimidazolesuccinocarboxamide synthase [Halalkalibacterium halodurans]Q9KF60.1 RecName: Full=Phosphoribosylaminoimidazole-succinocarboxamide synthase; AltName: Full=SAICAR synthetase [Halalkalibacterium halodurans C-125]MED4082745.1 phosphoribosylaminoimidazolesuccinocarboxamide synthase [Halalkalibacterium halodurans]MED4086671.1 phosphoribosylaminoimidazolesuccinocarboxamide synthase [Halalkalibacterium halodurans]MED4103247.1 phosphoribosylaminoimidazolesuccinocarboxamide